MAEALGLGLAFAVGVACRRFDLPVPAPPTLAGALLVVSMTAGYVVGGRLVARVSPPIAPPPAAEAPR